MIQLADWMKRVADVCIKAGSEAKLSDYASELTQIKSAVADLAAKFPVPGI